MRQRRSRCERGTTLVGTLLILLALTALTAAALSSATSGLQIARNYRGGLQALLAAETAVLHGAKVINRVAVVRFDTDIVDFWSSVFGTAERSMPFDASTTYHVSVAAHATDPLQRMVLNATGMAGGEARREVSAQLRLDGAFSPGAIFLPATTIGASFKGNGLLVDGRDHRLSGGLNPDGEDRPGIGVLNPNNVAPITEALNSVQKDNVLGLGGEPSVYQADGPSASRIVNEIVPEILKRPEVVTNPTIKGNDVFGTVDAPQITHFPASVKLSGTTTGAGIIIADQGFTVTGNLTFTGLIIVRGTTEITNVQGNVTVLGGIWTTNLNLNVSGSASVAYSSEALEKVANFPFGGNLLPQKVAIHAWSER
jgi:hypothetical protein